MTSTYDPRMLPLAAFARSGEQLSGSTPMADLPRLYAQSVDAAHEVDAHFSVSGLLIRSEVMTPAWLL